MPRKRKAVEAAPSLPEIGLVSIPVLCCLLGAALFVYEYGGREATLTAEFIELEEAVAASAYEASTIDDRQQTAAEKLRLLEQAARLARIQDELAALAEKHALLEAQLQDLTELEKLLAELESTRLRIEDLRVQRDKMIAERQSLFGGYSGTYVLVECVADAIVVYPDARRITLDELPEEREWLLGEIDAKGYVAIAVRPSGWYGNSFDAAKQLIYRHIDTVQTSSGRTIARTDFPLNADESLGPYLPVSG